MVPLVISNLIGASVSSAILLMTFEEFWTEATHACVFVIMLVGIRGEYMSFSEAVPYDVGR